MINTMTSSSNYEEMAPSQEGVVSRLCSKCKTNDRSGNSSWCKSCRNELAAAYRERQPKPIVRLLKTCVFDSCCNLFLWRSSHPKQICCSKSCYTREVHKVKREEAALRIPGITEGFILCTKCGEERPKIEYAPSRRHLKRSWCRDCSRKYETEWASNNNDRRSASSRKSKAARLLRRYGAPYDDFSALLEQQGGVCACCGGSEIGVSNGGFHIDHDHSLPEHISYRGLTCGSCNIGLGSFKDSITGLQMAIDYLERFSLTQPQT